MSEKYPYYPNTKFPDDVDNFEKFLNITPDDAELVRQYQEAIEKKDPYEATVILSQIPEYSKKLITAQRLNELRDATLAMEEFYSSDIQKYIQDKQQEWVSEIDRFTYVGEYRNINYVKNNIVKYDDNLYLNIYKGITPSNILPTDSKYWMKFTIEGKQGEHGDNAVFDFEWNINKSYQQNVIVTYENSWWISKNPNKGKIPPSNPQNWELVLTISQSIYPIQKNTPVNQNIGEIWMEVI